MTRSSHDAAGSQENPGVDGAFQDRRRTTAEVDQIIDDWADRMVGDTWYGSQSLRTECKRLSVRFTTGREWEMRARAQVRGFMRVRQNGSDDSWEDKLARSVEESEALTQVCVAKNQMNAAVASKRHVDELRGLVGPTAVMQTVNVLVDNRGRPTQEARMLLETLTGLQSALCDCCRPRLREAMGRLGGGSREVPAIEVAVEVESDE